MTHPLILQIASELDVSVEEINAIIAGERIRNDDHLFRIMKALGANGRGVYFCTVWKADTVPNALRNMPTYDYFGQVLEALNLSLDKKGYTSRLLVSNAQLVNQEYIEEVFARHPDVGIVHLTTSGTQDLQQVCRRNRRPILFLDYPTHQDPSDDWIISMKSQSAIEAVVAHLYQFGHHRIGFIQGPQGKQTGFDRYQGYCTGLTKVGLDYDEALVQPGNWHQSAGEIAMEAFLALDDRPTAIIASNDLMAFGAMAAIERHGLSIPNDISVVGYDDIAATEMTSPPLTSVRTPMSDMGAKAGEYIIDLLEGRSPEPRQVYFPLELIIRDSVGPAPQLATTTTATATPSASSSLE